METTSMNTDLCHVSEAGLSRVLNRLEESTDAAVMSAYRAVFRKDTNIVRNRKLRAELNQYGMGSYSLVGHWNEEQPDGTKKIVTERSMAFVKPDDMPRRSFQRLVRTLVQKYQQDAAILKEDAIYWVLLNKGARLRIGTNLTLGKMSQAYSTHVRSNVPFVFEGAHVPVTILGRLAAQRTGMLFPSVSSSEIRMEIAAAEER